MSRSLVLTLYNVALPLGLVVALPGYLLKMWKRGGYRKSLGQRFASYPDALRDKLGELESPYWIHAVSVGEVNIARKLIEEIRQQDPNQAIVLSTTTSTGYAVATKDPPDTLTVIFNPLDLAFPVRKALDLIRPSQIILVEAEIWPNLLATAHARGIPTTLVNARLSARSEGRFLKFRKLIGPIFELLDQVLVQDEEDIDRWAGLGVQRDRIGLIGSIKFDHQKGEPPTGVDGFKSLLEGVWGDPLPPILMGASTHPGEERLLGVVFRQLRKHVEGVVLLIAPRHVERAQTVESAMVGLGLKCARRSTLETYSDERPDVVLIDTTGELAAWQCLPNVVVIGKSFLAKGGQNPVEAIAVGTPVVTGPHMGNFQVLMRTLERAKGISRVVGEEALPNALATLFREPEKARSQAERALEALEAHQGATRRTVAILARAGLKKGACKTL